MNDFSNPWKKCSSSIVYKNPWITIREDKVIKPNGKDGIYAVVQMNPAVAVVVEGENQSLYLVGQYRYATDRYSWEVMAGGVNDNEELEEAAKRELLEEAGIVANYWKQLGPSIDLFNSVSNQLGYFFHAKELHFSIAQPEDTEVITLRQFSKNEILRLLSEGEIHDAFSIIAIERWIRSL